jgi:hypothetical protein
MFHLHPRACFAADETNTVTLPGVWLAAESVAGMPVLTRRPDSLTQLN